MSPHAHDHSDHDHHANSGAPRGGWSLLGASAIDRLLGAGAILAVMWAGVWWALQ